MAVKRPADDGDAGKVAKAAKHASASKDAQKAAPKRAKAAKLASDSSGAPMKEASGLVKPASELDLGEARTAAPASKRRRKRDRPADAELSPEELAQRAHQRKRRVRGSCDLHVRPVYSCRCIRRGNSCFVCQ